MSASPRRLPPRPAPTVSGDACSVLGTLDVVGDYWTLGVLRCATFGLRRFGHIQRELGVATNVLSDRLGRLVEARVLDRVPAGGRHEYVLTAKGLELIPVVLALKAWGDRHVQPAGPVTVVRHRGCGGAVEVAPRCPECGAHPSPADLEVVAVA